MQLVLPFIAISIVTIVGLFSSREIITLKKHIEETPTPTITQDESPTTTPTVVLSPTTHITITDAINPTSIPTTSPQTNTDSSDFAYPGSQNKGDNEYESTDNPESITNWYKEKVKAMGFNTKSFVTTKTNDNVNNVLAGASGQTDIKVTITRGSGDTTTHIKIGH